MHVNNLTLVSSLTRPRSTRKNMQKVDKLNSSIDIIPLQGSSGAYKSRTVENKFRMERSFRDQSLIARVQTVKYHVKMYMRTQVESIATTCTIIYR